MRVGGGRGFADTSSDNFALSSKFIFGKCFNLQQVKRRRFYSAHLASKKFKKMRAFEHFQWSLGEYNIY